MPTPNIPFWSVVTERIWQGGYVTAEDAVVLRNAGVTDLLNLDLPYMDHDEIVSLGLRVHWLPLHDMARIGTDEALAVIRLLDKILSTNGTVVYIHCNAGISRSRTVAWLYLLHLGLGAEEALKLVAPDGGIINEEVVDAVRRA